MHHDSATHPFDSATEILEQLVLEEMEADPDYWDELDRMEFARGACREWDRRVG